MSKLQICIDSTSLGSSGCILKFNRTVLGDIDAPEKGAYKAKSNAAMIYGVAVHKFIDVMFQTQGHFPTARKEADKLFALEKIPDEKSPWLSDPRHMIGTCYNAWTISIEPEDTCSLIKIPRKCYWCDGTGKKDTVNTEEYRETQPCNRCDGKGWIEGPATELTFHIPLYEDDFCQIYLDGTIDKVVHFHNGCYAIGDYKTTKSWKKQDYLKSYELNRQLRVYRLACWLTSQMHPTSILGKIGGMKMGAFIDAIFLKENHNENEYERTVVFQYSTEEIESFHRLLLDFCKKYSFHLQTKYFPKEGILNEACDGKWGKCNFWNVCKQPHQHIAELILNRDFKRVIYDPLAFNQV